MASLPSLNRFLSGLRGLMDASDRIEAARITDIWQALGHYADKKIPVIAQIHIPFGVSRQLRLTSALGGQITKSDHLTLGQSKASTGVIIPKTVSRKPPVNMAVFPRL